MIQHKQAGFSLEVVGIVVAIVVILGGLGYVYYTRTHQKSAATSTSAVSNAKPGTTEHVVQDITNNMQSESSAETSASDSAQQAVTSDNGSAGNVGGAYNENNL